MGYDPRITCQMDLDTMRQILDIDDVPQYDLGPVKNIGESTSLSTGISTSVSPWREAIYPR